MKARLLKATKIKELIERIPDNLDLYRAGNFEFLASDPSNYIETDLEIDAYKLSFISCSATDYKEVDNCRIIYEALQNLSAYLARDERLWIYLTHVDLLSYSRVRWAIPEDNDRAVSFIKDHFFVTGGARGIERNNAASRIWWMASLCKRINGLAFEDALTSLLYQTDVRANIIERPTTSQSIEVFSALLKKLHESYQNDRELFEREKFRSMMKELNLKGGVRLLGALSEKEIQAILDDCTAEKTKS